MPMGFGAPLIRIREVSIEQSKASENMRMGQFPTSYQY